MSAREATGSGSQARGGTGNHSARRGSGNQREPEGTGRRFDSLDAFIVRALSEPELTYLVPGLAPDRGRLLVVAPPNAGKTWLALAIAKAACGAGRKVFLIEEEGSRRKLGERLQSMAFPPESAFFVSHLGGLKIDDREDRQWLAQQLREADSPVIVLDPKGDIDLRDRCHAEARQGGRPHAVKVLAHVLEALGPGAVPAAAPVPALLEQAGVGHDQVVTGRRVHRAERVGAGPAACDAASVLARATASRAVLTACSKVRIPSARLSLMSFVMPTCACL